MLTYNITNYIIIFGHWTTVTIIINKLCMKNVRIIQFEVESSERTRCLFGGSFNFAHFFNFSIRSEFQH